MFNTYRLIVSSLFVLFLFSAAMAQENRARIDDPREPVPVAPLVTAAATAERVRFVSPGTVVQLRLEVYNETGQKIFDTEQHGGNVLDWHLQDGGGERLPSGSYACVLTIKSLSGRLSQRVGLVTVDDKKAAVAAAGAAQLSLAQQQTIGPLEGNAAFTIPQQSEAEALTAVTHDGTEGQLTSTRGALTFRTGNLFSGNDVERVRITPEGNIGIGTTKPKVKLDVVGMIRAREGFMFSDGSKLNVSEKGGLQLTNSDGSVVPNAAGTGTQDRVAKWAETGGAGTLGDSLISESNGNVVVGNAGQMGNIQIFGPAAQDVFAGMGPDVNAGPAFNYGYAGATFGRSAGFFNVRPDAGATPPNPSLRFMTANVERMIVTNTGNVGIGTTTPAYKLHLVDPSNLGLRVQTNAPGGTVASFGGNGDFQIDAPFVFGGRFIVTENGNVGIGTAIPRYKFHVKTGTDQNIVVRPGADFGSLTGIGLQSINDANTVYKPLDLEGSQITLNVGSAGNVGVGTASPSEKLSVAGTVQSTSGGFKFPDGSVQTTAVANTTYTMGRDIDLNPNLELGLTSTPVVQLNLPPGTYLLTATVWFNNTANFPAQNNTRDFQCAFTEVPPGQIYRSSMPGNTHMTATYHSVRIISSGSVVDLHCAVLGGINSSVFAVDRRFTAVKIGDNVVVQ